MGWERSAREVKLSGDIVVKGFIHYTDAIRLDPVSAVETEIL